MPATWQASGFAIWVPYWWQTEGIWLIHMPAVWYPYIRHMAKPYACYVVSTWQLYMAKPYSCHIDTTLQVYIGYVMWFSCADPYASSMVSTWQPYGIAIQKPHACHMAGIWLCHMAAVSMAYRRYMAYPYACCMVSIHQAYGKAICLLCGINMAAIYG